VERLQLGLHLHLVLHLQTRLEPLALVLLVPLEQVTGSTTMLDALA
jgi:hypothetical protein